MICEICNEETKLVKRYCNKVCLKKNPICGTCLDRIALYDCPFCRQNIYFPNPNKDNYHKNLGMMHELENCINVYDSIPKLIEKCKAVDLFFKNDTSTNAIRNTL